MTKDKLVKRMVERFLQWRLPDNFNPDGGISFKKAINENQPAWPQKNEPVGTNLFDAMQAEEMVRYMIGGMSEWAEAALVNRPPEGKPAPAKCNCSDVSGNSGPCPEHAARPAEFDDWWLSDGKFFDPDFSEVQWFDKRKALAEYAWHKARLSAQRLLATDNEMVMTAPKKALSAKEAGAVPQAQQQVGSAKLTPSTDGCSLQPRSVADSVRFICGHAMPPSECPRCHQAVTGPHECYNSVLNTPSEEALG